LSGLAAGPRAYPKTARIIFVGMLGISAVATQNSLAPIPHAGAPSRAVMTTNVPVFIINIGKILLGKNGSRAASAGDHAKHT
jgi:hypothetical protein